MYNAAEQDISTPSSDME